jgi:hypothetical protein
MKRFGNVNKTDSLLRPALNSGCITSLWMSLSVPASVCPCQPPSVRACLRLSVPPSICPCLPPSVRACLRLPVPPSVCPCLPPSVRASLRLSVPASVCPCLPPSARACLRLPVPARTVSQFVWFRYAGRSFCHEFRFHDVTGPVWKLVSCVFRVRRWSLLVSALLSRGFVSVCGSVGNIRPEAFSGQKHL